MANTQTGVHYKISIKTAHCNHFWKQEAFEKCWANSPLRAASRQFTRCRKQHCRAPPAHRCPRQRWRRQRMTEGTAMAPWNGPNNWHLYTSIVSVVIILKLFYGKLLLQRIQLFPKMLSDVKKFTTHIYRQWLLTKSNNPSR